MLSLLIGCEHNVVEPSSVQFRVTEPPSSAAAVAVSGTRVDIGWQDNSKSESGFEVHRSTAGPYGTFARLAALGPGVTTYGDAGLASSTKYCYKVRAFQTSAGNTSYSPFSASVCATLAPPNAPTGADAVPTASTAVGVYWVEESTNEDGFRVERSADSGATWAIAGTPTANGFGGLQSFVDGGRTPDTRVCYRVLAFNDRGDSPPSQTDCATPPAGPTNLTLTVVDSETIDLMWSDNSGVEGGYEVWRGQLRADWNIISITAIAELPENATSVRLVGVDFGYFYSVIARKDAGYSDFSDWVMPP
ncbi:MAG: fibronectin type III domain-containing protein [Chloroflexi bacterium]|nr:MAG: fibronectin type III domain-containing protein [Chloroflexota bacterium]